VRACGALGRYDRDRVLAIAGAMGSELSVAYEDEGSILVLDRPAIRWSAKRQRGLGWSECVQPVDAAAWSSWRDAATSGATVGLVSEGRRRFLHSSVSGVAPLYHQRSREAIYFASRIDALAVASSEPLAVDWDAWAAILTLDHPLGDRTPFVEIRRLAPFSTLRWSRGRARIDEHRWPWAEVEPRLDVATGAVETAARMRDAVAELPVGEVVCPLSGGWDSRLLLCLLACERRGDLRALTADVDGFNDRDRRLARAVAVAAGVPHEEVEGEEASFWRDLETRFERTDYQQVRHPWPIPLIDRLRGESATVTDGLALDTLAQPGGRMITAEAVNAGGSVASARALWRSLKHKSTYGGPGAFATPFARAISAAARGQLIADSARFDGHPARALLTLYRTRTVRGISLAPTALLGSELAIAMPFIDDRVAKACLAIAPAEKLGARLYDRLFAEIDPEIGALPSTNEGPPPPRTRTPRRHSPTAAVGYQEHLLDGPLTPFLRAQSQRRLARASVGGRSRIPTRALGPTLFHLWYERYRDRLGEVDPASAFGVAPAQARVKRRPTVGEASSSSFSV
jgi:Asparagine synthase